MRGAKRPRPVFSGQPLGAPLRRYFNAHAAAPYLCSRSAKPHGLKAGLTWASQPRRRRVRTPEAGPLASARVRRAGFRPSVLRAHLRRRDPAPHDRDGLGHASLMGQGWGEFKGGAEGGDKWCRGPLRANNGLQPLRAGLVTRKPCGIRKSVPRTRACNDRPGLSQERQAPTAAPHGGTGNVEGPWVELDNWSQVI
jgi:hypothetical protein